MQWKKYSFPAAIAGIISAVYLNTTQGEFLWDDQHFVQENRFLASWENLPDLLTRSMTEGAGEGPTNFYRPFQAFTHLIDVQLYGLDSRFHHLTNVLIAVALGIALYTLIRKLLGGSLKKYSDWAAFLAVLLYACHPLQSIAVAYISGRGDLLVLLFFVLSALAFEKHLGLAMLFSSLAILSKESGILVPAFLLACDWIRSPSLKPPIRQRLMRHLPIFGLVLIYLGLRVSVLNFQNTLNFYNQSNILTENYSYRVYTYFSTLSKSLELLFWPTDLHHERSWLVYIDWDNARVISGFMVLVGTLGTAFLMRRRAPILAIGLTWFILATLPTSNLIALINALIYDHWFIIPSLGIVFVAAWGIQKILSSGKRILPFGIGWSFVFFPMIALTWTYNDVWTTPVKLYNHILKYEPKSYKIANNLAMAYANDPKHWDDSQKLYEQSISIADSAQARNNFARLLLLKGKSGEAENQLRKALELNPLLYQAHTGLGITLLEQKRCSEAAQAFESALKIFPDKAAWEGYQHAKYSCLTSH